MKSQRCFGCRGCCLVATRCPFATPAENGRPAPALGAGMLSDRRGGTPFEVRSMCRSNVVISRPVGTPPAHCRCRHGVSNRPGSPQRSTTRTNAAMGGLSLTLRPRLRLSMARGWRGTTATRPSWGSPDRPKASTAGRGPDLSVTWTGRSSRKRASLWQSVPRATPRRAPGRENSLSARTASWLRSPAR